MLFVVLVLMRVLPVKVIDKEAVVGYLFGGSGYNSRRGCVFPSGFPGGDLAKSSSPSSIGRPTTAGRLGLWKNHFGKTLSGKPHLPPVTSSARTMSPLANLPPPLPP